MKRQMLLFTAVAILTLGSAATPPQENDEPSPEVVEFTRAVSVEFPDGGYSFTLKEAAKGIKLPYTFVVAENVDGVIPLKFGPSQAEPPGKSGLHPREEIRGGDQYYCLCDYGLAPPPDESREVAKTLKMGSYDHAIEWDGRNWYGPSDTGNPKGDPFPAGTYEVKVTIHGKLLTDKGKVPYQFVGKTKLVLK